MFVFWVGRKKYAQILPHFVSIMFLLNLFFLVKLHERLPRSTVSSIKKNITMFRCKLNSGLCFSSEVLLAGAGEGGTYVPSLNFKHYRFVFWIIGLVLVGVQPILMPFVAISSIFMLLLQGHVNCRNFTLSRAWFPGAPLLLLGDNNILVFFTKILCWAPWVRQF